MEKRPVSKGVRLARAVSAALLLCFAVALLWPLTACGCGEWTFKMADRSEVRVLSISTLMYAYDSDDTLPIASKWMDGLEPYYKSAGGSLTGRKDGRMNRYGIAFRHELSSVKEGDIEDPKHIAVEFDSVSFAKSANGGLEMLPKPGRYDGKNFIAFADGHVNPEPLRTSQVK